MQTLSRNTEDWDRQNTKVRQAASLRLEHVHSVTRHGSGPSWQVKVHSRSEGPKRELIVVMMPHVVLES